MAEALPLSRRQILRLLYLGLISAGTSFQWPPARAQTGKIGKTIDTKLVPARYDQVVLAQGLPQMQRDQSIETLLTISDDSFLKPFRERAGLPAPGADLGGWYDYFAGYDWKKGVERGFAPAHCFGQWLSALARASATGCGESQKIREKVASLVKGYSQAISPLFFKDARFPGYTYDKIVIGLIDAHRYAQCGQALSALEKTTAAVLPYLPQRVEDRETPVAGHDISFSWDEPYTLPENLFIAYREGAGEEYLPLAQRFLLNRTYFEPLAAGQDVLTGKHAYSYVNALGSAMQAYLTMGSSMHLSAAQKAFAMIQNDHSFVTGGWGPDEHFQKPGTGALGLSLEKTHQSFETPCGAYAHLKLTNYLTCVTADSKYGDSTEQVIYNTVLGAKPLHADGRAFYYSDYNKAGHKVYSTHTFPCCAGTFPQVACDYAKHAYFFAADGSGVYVNLYFNSTVKWQQKGRLVQLRQTSDYPRDGKISFFLAGADGDVFALNLRIPAWTEGTVVTVRVNGQLVAAGAVSEAAKDNAGFAQIKEGIVPNKERIAPIKEGIKPITAGTFFALSRAWKDGDNVELSLSRPLRLVSVDSKNPDLVALVCGPRVLFAISDQGPKRRAGAAKYFSRSQLLAARRNGDLDEWIVGGGEHDQTRFLPYTAIADETYSTYQKVL